MDMQEILEIIRFLAAQKAILFTIAGVAVLYALIELWAWLAYGPRDTTGNGIVVGDAKAFDNRSLTLRIERLSSHLATLKVVNQNITDNLAKTQQQTSKQTTREVTVDAKLNPVKEKADNADGGSKSTAKTTTESAESVTKPSVELAASDVLNEQLNLASQILNLEMLYERSLTDRLLGDKTRLQTVLGFQVSITPPHGCENSVAIVEIGVRMRGNRQPVSLVALIPQEKTYNSQTFSTSTHSIGGSAVTNVLTLGVNRKGESRQLFIHRDSDTLAFERDDQGEPSLFENSPNERVFGWEFRPVLGRKSVAPGTRQMLAVIALPAEDRDDNVLFDTTLEVRTRSYWRRLNARRQTTGGKWGWLPLWIDRSRRVDSQSTYLTIPTTKQIQDALAPRVKDVKWVNSGGDRATVIVTGSNFFTGTKIVIGGVVHAEDEQENKLVLKSNQALEFETSIASLGKGDCVLSGRFGPSIQLLASLSAAKDKDIQALTMTQAVVNPSAFTDAVYLIVDVKAISIGALDVDFEVADIQKLPEPLMFVGTESVPLPYDYFDATPENWSEDGNEPAEQHSTKDKGAAPDGVKPASSVPAPDPTAILGKKSGKKYVRVGAWISKKMAASPSVTFRVPFCGFEYQASVPLTYSDPTVSRLGDENGHCILRIASPVGFKKPFQVELDKVYKEGPHLQRMSPFDYRLKVPIATAARYQNIVVRTGSNEPYVLPIQIEEKLERKTMVHTSGKPPQIKKNSVGSLEWSGTALDLVKSVTLITKQAGLNAKEVKSKLDFAAYDEGGKLEVYFGKTDSEVAGKAELKFLTNENKILTAPLFIMDV